MSLAQLGQAIKDNAEKIEEYLKQNNIPGPSFSLGSAPRLTLPPDVEEFRQGLFDDLEHLTALLRGPVNHVVTHSNPVTYSYAIVLAAISRFRVADHVPEDGSPIRVGALAAACNMEQSDLLPLLRTAIANRTFDAVGLDEIKHNATSAAIVSIPELSGWLEFTREDHSPTAFALPEAIAKWPGASDPTHSAFALINPDHQSFFDAIKSSPARAKRFAGAMRLLSPSDSGLSGLAADLQLDAMPAGARIVELGGSMGEVLIVVLRRYGHLHGIVQDLPVVVEQAHVPEDLVGRLTFQAADFFEEQPVKGAEIYFLRQVLHDFSDEYARRILTQLVPALKNGARIILSEVVQPLHGVIPLRREQTMRGWSLAMKWLLNGGERDENEWKTLFASVDTRFQFKSVTPTSQDSLIEFVWTEPGREIVSEAAA